MVRVSLIDILYVFIPTQKINIKVCLLYAFWNRNHGFNGKIALVISQTIILPKLLVKWNYNEKISNKIAKIG